MRTVNLNGVFSLSLDGKNPSVCKLKFDTYGGSVSTISLYDFFDILPLQFTSPVSHLFNRPTLKGEKWRDRGFLGFVSDENQHPSHYVSHLTYSQYNDLKSDIHNINPNYHFVKKSGLTLDSADTYYKEALKDVTCKEVAKAASKLDDVINVHDFKKYFHPVNKKIGTYAVSYFDLEKIPSLHAFFKDHIPKHPVYSLKNRSSEAVVSYINEVFYVIKSGDRFEFSSFPKDKKNELIAELEAFFPETDTHSYNSQIYVADQFDGQKWSKSLVTTANFVANKNRMNDDFPMLRKFFQEKYDIKARGKYQLWEKGFEKLKESKLTYPYPFFSSMGKTDELKVIGRNNEVIESLLSSDENESLDTFMKLRLGEESQVLEDSHALENEFSSLISQNLSLFVMPDYGKISKKIPSFDDIIK